MKKEIKKCSVCGRKVRKDFLDADGWNYCYEHKHLRTSKPIEMSDEEFWAGMDELFGKDWRN